MTLNQWQFNLIFVVALGLLVFFSVAPYFGLDGAPNPLVVTGFGMIMGYIFTKRDKITTDDNGKKNGDNGKGEGGDN